MHLLIQNYHFNLVFLWLKKRRGILWFMSVNGNRWFCFRTRRCQPCILGEYFVHMILITTSIPKNSLICRENVLRHNPHFVTHPSLISRIVLMAIPRTLTLGCLQVSPVSLINLLAPLVEVFEFICLYM